MRPSYSTNGSVIQYLWGNHLSRPASPMIE